MKYDYLIVGAGVFGCTFAHEVTKHGYKCLVIDQRNHLGGNTYCLDINGIPIHNYGAHIFHTNSELLWKYVNQFTRFEPFVNSPLAMRNNRLYNLPFNMNTFYQICGIANPEKARQQIISELTDYMNPINLEQQSTNLVGTTLYNLIIKGYTQKQWGRPCTELPPFIIKRLPIRYTFNNNYFNDYYQGIPEQGYNPMIMEMLKDIPYELGTPYTKGHDYNCKKIVYTGSLDEYFEYCYGVLQYRSLEFEHHETYTKNHQGTPVINYGDIQIPYTRSIEHKHFYRQFTNSSSVVSKEFPIEWSLGKERYYPINDAQNQELFLKYTQLADKETNVIFGGRLAEYHYYDMHQVIASALKAAHKETN